MALADAVPFAVAHWSLDEASGTRFDSIGSNDLTDNNTVASATGMFGDAANFEADDAERLSLASNSDVQQSDIDYMIRAVVQLESKGATRTIVSKWNTGAQEYLLYYDSGDDRFNFIVRDGSTNTVGVVSATNFGSPSTATQYLIHAWHSATNNEVGIAVNAGTANTASTSGAPGAGASEFCIGGHDATGNFDGLIDDVVLVKNYILDATERSEDYNGGAGVAFADWAGGGGGGFVAYPRPRGLEAGMYSMSGGLV